MRRQTTLANAQTMPAKNWLIVDATDVSLGRLSVDVANVLMGKHRPEYTPHVDCGDFVIVINAAKVTASGDQREKKYYRHSQYPGGLKTVSQEKLLATRPERVVEFAIKGMLPHNAHGAVLLKHLKVYSGPDHPHQAQINAGKGKGREVQA